MLIKILLILGIAHDIYGQYFNSNPRQQDHSGGLNLQIDTSSTGTQYIGPRPSRSRTAFPLSYSPYGSSRRSGFNSNPRQQDFSGSSSNIQIDTSSNSRQYIGPGRGSRYPPTTSIGRPQYENGFNSNTRQQDLSGGRNVQIDSSGRSRQYIGPARGNQYSPTTSIGRPRYGNGFNSNPRQQDFSGGRNVQIDSSGRSRQYIGPRMMRPVRGSTPEVGVEYPNYGNSPRVLINGRDYTGQNVQQPGLHINQNPY